MQLNKIAQSFILARLLTSFSVPLIVAGASKDATAATRQANSTLCNQLPFSDNTDFTDAHEGFIVLLPQSMIEDE